MPSGKLNESRSLPVSEFSPPHFGDTSTERSFTDPYFSAWKQSESFKPTLSAEDISTLEIYASRLYDERARKYPLPNVSFAEFEKYKIVKPYLSPFLKYDWWKYQPSISRVKECRDKDWIHRQYKSQNDSKARAEWSHFLNNTPPIDRADYENFLITNIRKARFFGQSNDEILDWFFSVQEVTPDAIPYKFSFSDFSQLLLQSSEKEYKPRPQVVMFNPKYEHRYSALQKAKIRRDCVKQYNNNLVEKYLEFCDTYKELSDKTGLCRRTLKRCVECVNVKRIKSRQNPYELKSLGDKTRDIIFNWFRDNPNGSVLDCVKATGKGKSIIYRYLKKRNKTN